MVGQIQQTSSVGQTAAAAKKNTLDPQQFLQIMIKEMQNQDPFDPVSSKDLINQVSQIRSIQSNMELSQTLKDLSVSQKLTSASVLIGKVVTGLTSSGENISGLAISVKREGDKIFLELDSGHKLSVDNIVGVNENNSALPSA